MGYLRTGSFTLYAGLEWSAKGMVRFAGNGFAINEVPADAWHKVDGVLVKKDTIQEQEPTPHFKVVDGWEKDGNWGGHVQITSSHCKGDWFDSRNEWVQPVGERGDQVIFLDKGDYYEIHQRSVGWRVLTLEENHLRFVHDKSQAVRFNIKDR
ncbi:hypothetical protein ACWGHD_25100 [Streptomyces xanthophaeus]